MSATLRVGYVNRVIDNKVRAKRKRLITREPEGSLSFKLKVAKIALTSDTRRSDRRASLDGPRGEFK